MAEAICITVNKSPDINQSDTVVYQGEELTFGIDDKNTTDSELILIYMYILPRFQMHGVKVGMTKCKMGESFWHALKSRIGDQQHELALTAEQYEKYGYVREVVYWGICLDAKNESFKDYPVHDKIMSAYAGITEKEQEWFTNVPVDELVETFNKVRHRDEHKEIFEPREEQRKCIDELKTYFNENPHGRFLLNCKMRFGKSYTTYKFCEEENLKKILILTFIPAVESSWKEDLSHIEKEYRYFTDANLRRDDFLLNFIYDPFVMFLSLQNYLGKDKDAKVKAKIKQLQEVDWDLVVLDEYHFGAWNSRTQGTIKVKEEKSEDLESKYQDELAKTKDIIERFKINTQKTICLSGTPFKALERGEFNDSSTFTFSYFDEQRKKYPNSEKNDFSVVNHDYEHFPDMKIFGYNMTALFGNLTQTVWSNDKLLGKKYFSLNAFFATRQGENPNEPCTFIYEDEVKSWLNIIKGRSTWGDKFPYSNPKMRDNNKHTLWLMPNVLSCKAMEDLLLKDDYFSRYQIINLSKDGVGSGMDAFTYLNDQMTAAENTGKLGSIAITVNKLTIGVTVKKWFSVFVLKDLASPEQYFQAIFRIQTPYKENGIIKKTNGYVYDFNIDRASALLLKYAEQTESEAASKYTKLDIAKLIVKYLPIYINGDFSNPISEQVFYELAEYGDSSGKPLSKKIVDTAKTTRMLDEETMAAMLNDKEVSDIIKRVFAHAKMNKPKEKTRPAPPEEGFDSLIAKEGRDVGYRLGQDDYKKYVDYDDTEVQRKFEQTIEGYISEYCPKQYSGNQKVWYVNGFKKGYESGVNAPIRKEMCGKDDGKKFVDEVKKAFGDKIVYTKATKNDIDNFVKKFLNDINHIPEQYRGMLYKRWYCDSFLRAVKTALMPKIEVKDAESIEDTDNVLKHILARLFEFLYISVYRETTFNEIFKNADSDVFLEAVGITKQDFEVLNKYKVFQEDVLNNYIHDFFVNESLGSKLNLEDDEVKKQYRNSFDWFGFGLESEETGITSTADENAVMQDFSDNVVNAENDIVENTQNVDAETVEQENVVAETVDAVKSDLESYITTESPTVEQKTAISIVDRIAELLKANPRGLKAGEISTKLGMSKKEINQILFANRNMFEQMFITARWKLKVK